ncbi:MAG: signal peptide peptidase SppA [Rhodospirillales bacterium]|nr:signal peptide peptidase SppA [Rhodospirillales bacterium]MCB9995255.1 signal peptide peptidase SppA [Rhodospirillales bacterium]
MMSNNRFRSRSLFGSPKKPQRPHKKWRVKHVVVTALKRTCMAIGAMVLISSLLSLTFSSMLMKESEAPSLPDEMVLFLPLEEDIVEHEDLFASYGFSEKHLTIRKLVDAIDSAGTDDRVKGLVFKLSGGGMNLTHLETVRDAVVRFKSSGKPAYIYASAYEGVGEYQLASAFDEIWLQPMGIVSIPGMAAEMPYAREALDKIGVAPQIFARKDYKNFFESFTRDKMSDASREMMTAIIGDMSGRAVSSIAAGRGMDPKAVEALVDKGLFTGEEALTAGLVDKLDYTDTFNRMMQEKVTGDPESDEAIYATVQAYAKETSRQKKLAAVGDKKKPRIALVYMVGQLVEHDQGGNSLGAADVLTEYLRDTADDEDIKAVVLRIDSPGGSPVAAEAVRRAVEKVKADGKKVIVSMGASAASGGYWIAAPADYIFAGPSTMTGSIGVTGGKFALQELWGKIGVNWDRVSWGDNAGLWSFNEPYNASQTERMNAMMDSVYDRFIAVVAEGRGMTPAQVDKIAGGRVWTGSQALDKGLVDALGGLNDALDYTAKEVGAADRHGVQVVVLPHPKSPFERVVELLEGQVQAGQFLSRHGEQIKALDHVLQNFEAQAVNGVTATAPGWVLAE